MDPKRIHIRAGTQPQMMPMAGPTMGPVPAIEVKEFLDSQEPSYKVVFQDETYTIFGKEGSSSRSWGIATFTLFHIVNRTLEKHESEYKFYALYGGNDLHGPVPASAAVASRGTRPAPGFGRAAGACGRPWPRSGGSARG